MTVSVLDTETNAILMGPTTYAYVVRPQPSAYENEVLLARTVHYLVELRFLQRLINLYSREDPVLTERLKGPHWGASIELLSTTFIEEKRYA